MVAPPSVKLAEGKLNGVFGPAMITVPDTVVVVFSAPFTSTCATCEATVPSAMFTTDPVAATAVAPNPTASAITAMEDANPDRPIGPAPRPDNVETMKAIVRDAYGTAPEHVLQAVPPNL